MFCLQGGKIMIRGRVAAISRLGGIVPSFSVEDFLAAGFEYGDLVTVYLGNDGVYTVPFVTNYTDAGCLGLVLVDYRASHRGLSLSISNDTLANILSCNPGENFTVVMREKGGYLATYRNIVTIYSDKPEDYSTKEAFANFREIKTTGMAKRFIYRSSNPFNDKRNKARRSVAEALCARAGINAEIDLGDDEQDIEEALKKSEIAEGYCARLYREGRVVLLRLKGGALAGEGARRLAQALRFIISQEGPFVIHCDEGKDRAGFVCLLLEALAGAKLEELQQDYMQTFCNYYHLEKESEKYKLIEEMNVNRLLYIIAHPEQIQRMLSLNWEMLTLENLRPQEAAIYYCQRQLGLTMEEIVILQRKLQKGLSI